MLHHIEAFGGIHQNTLLFSGFQAAGTRGRKLLEGAREVKIHGRWMPINAEVAELPMLSAHADSDELMRWLGGFTRAPEGCSLFMVNPMPPRRCANGIQRELKWHASVPMQNQEFAL